MPEIEFGRIGKLDLKPPWGNGPLIFMVICPRPDNRKIDQVIILDGEVLFEGRWHRLGDIGPVSPLRDEIEWLE